ncbi:hypothetical protein YC2023_106384 [Brassica napus]
MISQSLNKRGDSGSKIWVRECSYEESIRLSERIKEQGTIWWRNRNKGIVSSRKDDLEFSD